MTLNSTKNPTNFMTPKFMMVNGTKVYDLGNGLEIAHNLTRVFDTQFTLNYDNDQVEKGMDMELSQPPSHEIVPLVGRHVLPPDSSTMTN